MSPIIFVPRNLWLVDEAVFHDETMAYQRSNKISKPCHRLHIAIRNPELTATPPQAVQAVKALVLARDKLGMREACSQQDKALYDTYSSAISSLTLLFGFDVDTPSTAVQEQWPGFDVQCLNCGSKDIQALSILGEDRIMLTCNNCGSVAETEPYQCPV